MKTQTRIVLFLEILLFSLLLATPVFALQTEPPGGLSEGQLVIVGLVASASVWVLRLIVKSGYNPSREVVAIALYVVSFFLSVWFTAITFPPFPPFADAPSFIGALLSWIGEFLTVASPVAGMAYLIYNVLLQRVLEGIQAKLTGK